MSTPSIADVKALQREQGITDHVVWLGPYSFVIAHTDAERSSHGDLEACGLHIWLLDGPPDGVEIPGYYVVVPHELDAHSEPYRADPWDFHPLRPEGTDA